MTDGGAEASTLDLVIQGQLIWCVSEAVLSEYRVVLNRSKFHRIESARVASVLALAGKGELAVVTKTVACSLDEPDNRFLECAEATSADYLVTGNKRHFPARWEKTEVVNARKLLDELRN